MNGPRRARFSGRAEPRVHSRTLSPTVALLAFLSVSPTVRLSALQCPDGSPPPCRAQPTAYAAPSSNSVAVLYFDNLSPDTSDAYLADGLSEEIAARLGSLQRLSVKQASREGIRRLRETAPDYRIAAGRALGVRYLVEGSLRRAGSRVRVVVRLVNGATGFRTWGETYDRAAQDLLALEEEVAREVVTSIAGQLAPSERTALAERPTTNSDAYEHFLRGNYYLAKRSANGTRWALEEYRTAAGLDPRFTRAIAREGFVYGLILTYRWALPEFPRDSILPRGVMLADRALAQDSTVSDAWLARAYMKSFQHPQTLEGVMPTLDRALALDPRNSEALQMVGFILRIQGRDSAAQAAYLRSLEVEPERAITLSALGLLRFLERRYAEASRWMDSSLRVSPEFYLAYLRRSRTRLMVGDQAGARADAQAALSLGDADSSLAQALLAMADAQRGDTTAGRARLNEVLRASADASSRSPVEEYLEEHLLPAAALVILGDRERALSLLESVRPPGARFWSGLRAPEFDPIRSDPRFQRLVEESRRSGAPK